MACVTAVRRKQYVDGKFLGRGNTNPILDTRQYDFKFFDRGVTKLTNNVIVEVMYAQ